jgi:hypothetical protein
MSKEKGQEDQKNHQAQRPSPVQEMAPVAEFTPAVTGLQHPGQLTDLPAHRTTNGIRQATILQMQKQQGNAAVQQLLHHSISDRSALTTVQRTPTAAQQAQWQTDWNDASLQRYQRHFRGDGRPSELFVME